MRDGRRIPFPGEFALTPVEPDGSDACPCELVWHCERGRTRLSCDLQADGVCYRIKLLRNSRTYGTYQFAARDSALTFAQRLRLMFEGNGWRNGAAAPGAA